VPRVTRRDEIESHTAASAQPTPPDPFCNAILQFEAEGATIGAVIFVIGILALLIVRGRFRWLATLPLLAGGCFMVTALISKARRDKLQHRCRPHRPISQ
jgi:hypothetical protein